MRTYDCILNRRSTRKFKCEDVSILDVYRMLEAAMAAPSAKNSQPWEFYIIKTKEVQDQIKAISPAYNYNSRMLVVVAFNLENTLSKSLNDFAIQDCSAAIENMLLTAEELELGTVWCGAYPNVERSNAIRTILKEKDNIVPLAVIQIGYKDEIKEPRTQFDSNKVHTI